MPRLLSQSHHHQYDLILNHCLSACQSIMPHLVNPPDSCPSHNPDMDKRKWDEGYFSEQLGRKSIIVTGRVI